MPFFFSFHHNCCTDHIDVADMYNIMSLFFLGGVSMGDEVRYILRLSKAFLASSVHSNLPVFFSSLKKGSPFLPSHEMKRLSTAMLPVNFCTSFTLRGGAISVMAQICLVIASIPHY
jgi:hypothetical protein